MAELIKCLFIAFGAVFGASVLGGMSAIFTLQSPTDVMMTTAEKMKIWALVAALGGTIDPLRVIETNFLEGHLSPAIKQIVLILFAFIGAHMGTELIRWITQGAAK